MSTLQIAITIGVVVAGTMLTRFLPYICFPQGKETPPYIIYLGKFLAPAVFGFLVVYCLRNVNFTGGTFGIPEIAGIAVTAISYWWRQNMMLSMALGTGLYMFLVQAVFV